MHGRQAELADVDHIAILVVYSGHFGLARELVLAIFGRWRLLLFNFELTLEDLFLQGAPSSGRFNWSLNIWQCAYLVIQFDRVHIASVFI